MFYRTPRNFRLRTRIYPRRYFDGYRYYAWDSSNFASNVSSIDQTITNFGTQEDVSQNAFVNQTLGERIKI